MDRIAEETERRIAQAYALRRQAAADAVAGRIASLHAAHPALADIDRAIAVAGSELVLESLGPVPDRSSGAQDRLHGLAAQKEVLLRGLGIDPSYDRPARVCGDCADTGTLSGGEPCPCRGALRTRLLTEASGLGSLASCTFDVQDKNLFDDRVNENRDKADVSPRVQWNGVRIACRTFAAETGDGDAGVRDLLLVGSPGTGKTFMAASIANEVIARGRSVRYLPAPAMFDILGNYRTLCSSFRPDEERFEDAERDRAVILESRLLVVDDLGTESVPPHTALPELLNILDRRHGDSLRTVFCTNVDLKTLQRHYDERLWSRIIGRCTVLRFIGDDLRLRALRMRRPAPTRGGADPVA
ncbi:MAG: ATP-binding protein [Clostridia bacterium]|nr:ATP-binding protein [Clostridia bacterium]